jgi:hypothetical protein
MAEDVVERLARMRRAMVKMRRAGRQREFDVLAVEYARVKAEQMEEAEVEQRERARARRAARVAERAVERPARWKLPPGFGTSPLAAQRAREGRPEVPVVPVGRPALSPWRRGNPAAERIWRP